MPSFSVRVKLYAIFAALASIGIGIAAAGWMHVRAAGYTLPYDPYIVLAGALAAAAVVVALIGIAVTAHILARPLAVLVHACEAAGRGNVNVSIPYRERADEIGNLAQALTMMQAQLRDYEAANEKARWSAEAHDQQRRTAVEAAAVEAGKLMESSLSDLNAIATQMLAASERLTSTSNTAAARTGEAANASEQTSVNVRDIAAAADELAASVNEIDRQVAQSNAIATKAAHDAERTNAAVKQLDQAAGRIGDVVRLITDIAEQTNLLALNATIEAARAGEAGRGFAVVAGEVKALAGQTAKATKDIGTQIADMQQATLRSVEAIAAIEHTIREIGEISGAIAAAVTEQGAATQEIARGVELSAQRAADTASDVARVGEATGATCDATLTVRQMAEQFGAVANRLRLQIAVALKPLDAA